MQQIPSKPGSGREASPADAIRQLVVPQVGPPYDDEADQVAGGARDEGNAGWVAGADSPGHCRPGPVRELNPGEPVSPQPAEHGTSRRNPDIHGARRETWPGQFAQVLAETLAGSRPHRQLAPWTTEQARRQIRQLGPLFATGERPLVRRVMTMAPASGVLELTAVVGFGPRVRVLALRLERAHGERAWCCTAVESA